MISAHGRARRAGGGTTPYSCDVGQSCVWGKVSYRRTSRLSNGAELEHAARGPYEWNAPELCARHIGNRGQAAPTITEYILRDASHPLEARVPSSTAVPGATEHYGLIDPVYK